MMFLDLSLLKRNKAFALLYTGQFISTLGTMITNVALPFQIYKLSDSTAMVGLLGLAQLLPLIFTALLGGVYADRYPRRKLLLISEVILLFTALLLMLNATSAEPHIAPLFILAALMSAVSGLHSPSFEGALQQVVSQDDYKTAGALRFFKSSFCMIVGPAIAGIILANFGISFTYAIDALSFLCAVISVILLDNIPKPNITGVQELIMTAMHSGIKFALKRQELLGSYCVDFIAMVFAMPTALFPAMGEVLGDVKTLGLLYASPAIGSLIISLWSGWAEKIKHEGQAIAISAMFWGLGIVGFGITHNLGFMVFCLIFAGAADACSGIFRVSLWNRTIPQELRGRLAGIEMLSYLSGPRLGDTRAGFVAARFGLAPAIISGGALCVLGVGLCCSLMPKFWSYKE
jgi:MFS family permease